MTRISRVMAGAAALAVLGLAAIPAVGYAAATANTDVEVTIGAECLIGNGSANNSGEALMEIAIGAASSDGIDAGSAAAAIDITCNQAWTLSEKALNDIAVTPTNQLALKSAASTYDGAVGFNALSGNITASATPVVGDVANFGANTWGMAYRATGATLANSDWHTPGATDSILATGVATAKSSIVQYFGAKTDGSVAPGTYGATVTYTLAP